MKRNYIASLALLFLVQTTSPLLVQLNYFDSLPLISPVYPFDFLNSEIKADYAGDQIKDIAERVQFSANLFMQTTNYANNQDGIQVPAGDIHGRIGLLAMTYGSVPKGQRKTTLLTTAGGTAFTTGGTITGNLSTTEYADPNQQFGFLSNPAQFRAAGTRMNGSIRLFENVVISVNGGFCDMRQSITGLEDQTPYASSPTCIGRLADEDTEFTTDKQNVENLLTRQWQKALQQLGIDYSDWHEIGIEDPTISLTYRGNIPVQQEADNRKWTKFLIIPHATVSFTAGLGDTQNPDKLLSLPFGSNGHNSISIAAGVGLAFNETIEVFAEGCATQYTTKTQLMRVPTSLYQFGLYPYKTSVKVSPANTYSGSFGLNAHYFVDRLSGYVQVAYASHEQDDMELIQNDPAYIISKLEEDTEWKYGAVNLGLNYDLSPNISLGGACQLPMGRRGAYLTNTFMLGMTGTF
jgi:hypothetical protein